MVKALAHAWSPLFSESKLPTLVVSRRLSPRLLGPSLLLSNALGRGFIASPAIQDAQSPEMNRWRPLPSRGCSSDWPHAPRIITPSLALEQCGQVLDRIVLRPCRQDGTTARSFSSIGAVVSESVGVFGIGAPVRQMWPRRFHGEDRVPLHPETRQETADTKRESESPPLCQKGAVAGRLRETMGGENSVQWPCPPGPDESADFRTTRINATPAVLESSMNFAATTEIRIGYVSTNKKQVRIRIRIQSGIKQILEQIWPTRCTCNDRCQAKTKRGLRSPI